MVNEGLRWRFLVLLSRDFLACRDGLGKRRIFRRARRSAHPSLQAKRYTPEIRSPSDKSVQRPLVPDQMTPEPPFICDFDLALADLTLADLALAGPTLASDVI
jgi:hypothetical protein